jgi:hypothetical protein
MVPQRAFGLAQPALAALVIAFACSGPSLAEGGGGGGDGGGGSPAQSHLDELQRRAEERDRTLERSRPRTEGTRTRPAPRPVGNWVDQNTVRTPGGDIFTRPRGYVPLYGPGQTPPPEGWTRRQTLANGWQIYSGYADGTVVVRSPNGDEMRRGRVRPVR